MRTYPQVCLYFENIPKLHTTNELCRCNFNVELTGKIDASFGFGLTTTVGEKDIRAEVILEGGHIGILADIHSYAIFVLTVKNLHSFDGFGNGSSTSDEHSVNIESKGK
jgi:hypothetical protein